MEDIRKCGEYDVVILDALFSGGATCVGVRFGPSGVLQDFGSFEREL